MRYPSKTKKKCSVCQKKKSLELFYKNRLSKDGRLCRCKPCHKEYLKKRACTVRKPSKICPKCREEKHSGSFYSDKTRPDGRAAYCKDCDNKRTRERSLLSKYGLTVEEYEEIIEGQGGGCAICGKESDPEGIKRFLSVDHCHDSGEIRGVLCSWCNKGIGFFENSPERLAEAVEYLRRNR